MKIATLKGIVRNLDLPATATWIAVITTSLGIFGDNDPLWVSLLQMLELTGLSLGITVVTFGAYALLIEGFCRLCGFAAPGAIVMTGAAIAGSAIAMWAGAALFPWLVGFTGVTGALMAAVVAVAVFWFLAFISGRISAALTVFPLRAVVISGCFGGTQRHH